MEHRRSASAEFPNDNPELHDGALWVVSRPCAPLRVLVRGQPLGEPPPVLAEGEFDEPDSGDLGPLDVDVDDGLSSPAADVPEPLHEADAPAVEALEGAADGRTLEPSADPDEASPPALAVAAADETGTDAAVVDAEASSDEADAASETDAFSVFVSALVRVAMDAGASRLAAALPGFLEQGLLATEGLSPEVVDSLVSRGFAGPGEGGLRASADFAMTSGNWRRVLRGQSDDLSACGTSTLDGWAAELLAAALGQAPDAVRKLRRELRRLGVAAFGIIEQAA